MREPEHGERDSPAQEHDGGESEQQAADDRRSQDRVDAPHARVREVFGALDSCTRAGLDAVVEYAVQVLSQRRETHEIPTTRRLAIEEAVADGPGLARAGAKGSIPGSGHRRRARREKIVQPSIQTRAYLPCPDQIGAVDRRQRPAANEGVEPRRQPIKPGEWRILGVAAINQGRAKVLVLAIGRVERLPEDQRLLGAVELLVGASKARVAATVPVPPAAKVGGRARDVAHHSQARPDCVDLLSRGPRHLSALHAPQRVEVGGDSDMLIPTSVAVGMRPSTRAPKARDRQ